MRVRHMPLDSLPRIEIEVERVRALLAEIKRLNALVAERAG